MSKMKIICSGCYTGHRISQEKFPLMLLKRIVDPDDKKKMINTCIGFLCWKCSRKKKILDEVKKDPSLQNIGWREALKKIREKTISEHKF